MISLKTTSGYKVLESDIFNKYKLSKHVCKMLGIYWNGSTFEQYCNNKKHTSLAILKWLYEKENLSKKT